jgi:ribosomal protein S12 methylthiotransferase accessory factor
LLDREGVPNIYVFPLGGGRYGIEAVRVPADDLVSMRQPNATLLNAQE